MHFAFTPHLTKGGRICNGHPDIINPEPNEGKFPNEEIIDEQE